MTALEALRKQKEVLMGIKRLPADDPIQAYVDREVYRRKHPIPPADEPVTEEFEHVQTEDEPDESRPVKKQPIRSKKKKSNSTKDS